MAIVLVQKTLSSVTTLGVNTATLAGTTAGNMIVVAITYFGGGSDKFSTIVGTADSYTLIGSVRITGDLQNYCRLYYAKNIAGGSEAVAVTFTGSPGSGDTNVAVYEYSGADTTAPLDTTNPGTTGNSSSVSPGAVTPTQNNCLIVSVGADDNGNNATPTANTGQGFVLESHQDDSTTHERFYYQDVVQTTATSATASFTIAVASNFVVQAGVFKASSSTPGGSASTSTGTLAFMGAG